MKVYNEKEDQVLNLNDEVLSQLISTILDENYKLIEGLIKEQLEINVFNKLDVSDLMYLKISLMWWCSIMLYETIKITPPIAATG